MTAQGFKFIFFTGKGGVGKTTLACATAVAMADKGKKVLLISTDPASNLQDVLGTPVSDQVTQHQDLNLLFTVNIDPQTAAEDYRKRVIDPLAAIATADEISKIREGLSGACTTEIASFDEFSRFITGEGLSEIFDTVIFDTAPTGHTIRLLELPAAWDDFLGNNPNGASCIGPSSALKSSRERYEKVVSSLRDPLQTTFFLITRPDAASLKEAGKTSRDLIDLGMANQSLLINGIFQARDQTDTTALKMEKIAERELLEMPGILKNLAAEHYPLLPYNVLGLENLRSVFDTDLQSKIVAAEFLKLTEAGHLLPDLKALVDELEKNSDSGLIMTMGKGGVGKTIVAASIATMLAHRGHTVLLTTTDPAAHIRDFMDQLTAIPEKLTIERIDPKIETKDYIDKIAAQKGKHLDEEGKKLLREDLQSPCTEEVAVFHAFSKAIQSARRRFVVMDTAPTGHTLLLLDTTGSYHKEIMKNMAVSPSKITKPYMMLQDGVFAKILLVALPETTPMREAEALQKDLQRAGIVPYAWVINECLSAVNDLKDPLLRKRASAEVPIIDHIAAHLSKRTFEIPYIAEEKLLPAILSRYDDAVIQAI
ncbi:arsenical pump-driving ATPase [Mucilaginibacter rubeus]|uniref:arsenite-transporting ATPase n=1 Tax=Mucilaginibacter rubeus TaxID=2027860 RepID=A0AAE6JGU1_9SPHI|nr:MULTISPECIES: arsenical pump-driving ATPase [Mucilaginibacter]QEM04785.1 arsenical pump-driving ATPase [Mucilaginibacter rubeus]QEM17379.1 arsenical pump-driving ATPase [Mucilaginibacter gossypii]QTE46104.1 arsenical pump-driving ATPase [Mucilaginibacter rubeus]QTE52702.1 arsenical pump-driving ATPase [Mucilaginibacter rubeus]QTE57789.1 arsenical pump-driving ATPase [Mucilaginibacter rubeus]